MQIFTISHATEQQLPYFLKHSTYESIQDLVTYRSFTAGGLLLAKLDNSIIGCILAQKYSDQQSNIGRFYIEAQHRKKGYGRKLFEEALNYLSTCKCIRLTCQESLVGLYAKWGFGKMSDYQIRGSTFPYIDEKRNTDLVFDVKAIDLEQLLKYDHQAINGNRDPFLLHCFASGYTVVSLDKNKSVVGYAVTKKGTEQNLYEIPVLIAENNSVAEDLIKQIIQFFKQIEPKVAVKIYLMRRYQQVNELIEKWFDLVMWKGCKLVKADPQIKQRIHIYSTYGL